MQKYGTCVWGGGGGANKMRPLSWGGGGGGGKLQIVYEKIRARTCVSCRTLANAKNRVTADEWNALTTGEGFILAVSSLKTTSKQFSPQILSPRQFQRTVHLEPMKAQKALRRNLVPPGSKRLPRFFGQKFKSVRRKPLKHKIPKPINLKKY